MAITQRNNLLGKKFNKWTVIDYSDYREKSAKDIFWLCRCECGLEKPVKACYLKSGQSKQCVNCAHANQVIKGRLLPKKYWEHIERNAGKRDIEFKLTQRQVVNLLKKQNNKCALTGLPIEFSKTESDHNNRRTTASIDRIDQDKAYVITNIQIVHKVVNFMKHTLQQSEFIEMCKLVANHVESKE